MGLGTEQNNWITRFVNVLVDMHDAYLNAKNSMLGRWLCKRRRKA